ncbi:DUF559 domain-containing protein [Microbacterium sp. 10M-3C3]|jgi:very-short-patch-repair endonuclease|uniref:DUF559 domain-containing protein n=1 Tax=Microbacterium sp. 10M-3C3 TaxID=2483401 RepID=UPI000F632B97|nr:DUF559 domain-containing protein [Microbacterium sp. 10M-3C3]
MPDVISLVRALDGVARTATLRERGLSDHRIADAVRRGALSRVRRGWVALPSADTELVEAARAGVVLTCVTQARRLGLWVLAEPRPHVAAPGHAGHVASAVGHVHWAAPVVPRHPDALVDPVENVLAVAASCLPHEEALAVWESALRQGMVDIREMRRLDLGPAARALCDEADPYADSGLESFAVPRLRWLGLPLRRQVWIAGHRVDLLIGERLAFQIDGGHHVGAQREEDIAHDVALGLLGYRVIRVGYRTIVDDWASVQERIMRAIAQGWHRA